MDEFQQFDNTAGFFVGNEVLTSTGDSSAAPYVKAAARDMKAYRNSKGYRNIPVGYSAGMYRPPANEWKKIQTDKSQRISQRFVLTSRTTWLAEATPVRLLTSSR